MKIAPETVVALSYTLEVEGKIADSASSDKPLEYIHDSGMLLPRFEQEIDGKEPGDRFEFTLSPEEGYGEYNPAFKFDIPKSSFEVEGRLREDLLRVGAVIPMLNGAGQVIQGTIAEIGADTVKMDFNHPMAGKTLHFTGTVVSVREATEKELQEGLQHHCHCGGEGGCKGGCHEDGCHHEDGGCGNCGCGKEA